MPLSMLGQEAAECGVSAPPPNAPSCSCGCVAGAISGGAARAGAVAACMADSWARSSALQHAVLQRAWCVAWLRLLA